MRAVTQFQCGDDDDQDWDEEVLNHVLVHVLDKDQVEASAADDFAMFVIANRIDDVRLPLTVSEEDLKLMGHDVNFKTFRALQTLKKMLNKQISDVMSEDDENMWFLNLGKWTVMCHMMRDTKVTTIPSATSTTAPYVPLG